MQNSQQPLSLQILVSRPRCKNNKFISCPLDCHCNISSKIMRWRVCMIMYANHWEFSEHVNTTVMEVITKEIIQWRKNSKFGMISSIFQCKSSMIFLFIVLLNSCAFYASRFTCSCSLNVNWNQLLKYYLEEHSGTYLTNGSHLPFLMCKQWNYSNGPSADQVS